MLKMVGIDKSFNIGTINEKQIFKGLNLTINDGDFITVIGGNGAGKIYHAQPGCRCPQSRRRPHFSR